MRSIFEFSSSGYFGSTQYYLLINDLLKKKNRSSYSILNPDSDFEDDSIDFGKIFHNKSIDLIMT